MTIDITDASFEKDVLNSDLPVLLDFWAPWCGPCKAIAPLLEEIASIYTDKVKVCKLNIDDNSETAGKFGVRGIPTLMIFNQGEVSATKVGSLSKTDLVDFIDSNI